MYVLREVLKMYDVQTDTYSSAYINEIPLPRTIATPSFVSMILTPGQSRAQTNASYGYDTYHPTCQQISNFTPHEVPYVGRLPVCRLQYV